MANKKDLAQAQNYSRARLVTAFTSGMPGGKELEPHRGLTPVLVGVGLTAVLVLASAFHGFLSPGLPSDWANNRLIVAKESASRFVSMKGTLYPVINTTSARLLIPSSDYKVLVVDDAELEGLPVGNGVGIAGAPDILPNRSRLSNGRFASCVLNGAVRNVVAAKGADDGVASPAAESGAVVAQVNGDEYVVTAGRRHKLPQDRLLRDQMLRVLGLGQAQPVAATVPWINLFDEGTPLTPVEAQDEGKSVRVGGDSYKVGALVSQEGNGDTSYVVMADGSLTPLSGVTLELYMVGKAADLVRSRTLSVAQLGAFANAKSSFMPADWPTRHLDALANGAAPCAIDEPESASDARTSPTELGTVGDAGLLADSPSHTKVASGSGALVRTTVGADGTKGTLYVIDGQGTAYPVPDDSDEIIARLGFQPADVRTMPRSWADVLAIGVSLSPDDAGLPARFATTSGTATTPNGGQSAPGTSTQGTRP